MPDKEAQINFDAPATLRKWPSLNNERINASLGARPYMIIDGTLDECIRKFMSQPTSQHHLYEIHTAAQSDLVTAILSAEHMLNSPGCGIFSKPKFPPGAFRHRHDAGGHRHHRLRCYQHLGQHEHQHSHCYY